MRTNKYRNVTEAYWGGRRDSGFRELIDLSPHKMKSNWNLLSQMAGEGSTTQANRRNQTLGSGSRAFT
jgi:hypothetical protein